MKKQASYAHFTPQKTLLRSALLGFAIGLRSMAGPVLLEWTKARKIQSDNQLITLLTSRFTRNLTTLLASGELIGDKLPILPPRTKGLPLLTRLGFGALGGYSLGRGTGQLRLPSALLGALGAGLGAYAGTHARSFLAKKTHIPDPIAGLLEDGLTYTLGLLALREDTQH
uniref:Membrane protein n=1 Tax=Thermosporothrix sp. COM3 TaxID=2490863 RepID=A0A455ST74_9CHLR|nr:membrane protein [Thermosporothrix sp. COM3]